MSQPNALAAQRRKARHYGLQALYQWTLSGASATDIEAEFRVDNDFQHTDGEYFSAVLKGVVKDVEALEALFSPSLDRKLEELDPIERNLLRLGTFELRDRIDVPYKVVINEAVALAKSLAPQTPIVTSMACSIRSPEICEPWSTRKRTDVR